MHEAAAQMVQGGVVQVSYLGLILLFPLIGVLFNLFAGPRVGKGGVSLMAPAVIGLAFVVSCIAFVELLGLPPGSALEQNLYPWIMAGSLQIDVVLRVDALSAVMISIVSGVGFLIHVYSVGYMHDDPRFARYFTYLNLFMLAMLILVLADSVPVLFVGWEGVGLCSYLLIGFWFTEEANAIAGKKAFVVNRIGDAGFLLATFLLFWNLGPGTHSLSFQEIAARVGQIEPSTLTLIGLLLFVGATGKSAQLPLYIWLPDAMAGPTPVSALIHAATMVTAGVYMVARLNFLYVLAPGAMEVVATIGALTAIFAATIGLAQNDIKKVLAYSTVSQLGYMFLGVGVGAFSAGVFHLMTHAFFKGLLFLGSGSVIHGMSGEQDMRKMGGLKRHMPVTFWTFLVATLAITGMPGFAGFFSKDAILAGAMASGHVTLWVVGVVAAGLTSFYMFRLLFMTFFGECRADEHARNHIHESPSSMLVPLVILAVLSAAGGWIGLPMHILGGDRFGEFLSPVFGGRTLPHMDESTEIVLMIASVGVAAVGFMVALVMYVLRPALPGQLTQSIPGLYRLILNKYYVDEIYDVAFVGPTLDVARRLWSWVDVGVIDAAVNGTANTIAANSRVWRRVQTGNVQHYAVMMLLGALMLLGYYALG